MKLGNWISFAKTLATKQQPQQFAIFDNAYESALEMGPSTISSFREYAPGRIIAGKVEDFPEITVVISKWLKYGYHYKRHFMVCTGKDNSGLPQFEDYLNIIII